MRVESSRQRQVPTGGQSLLAGEMMASLARTGSKACLSLLLLVRLAKALFLFPSSLCSSSAHHHSLWPIARRTTKLRASENIVLPPEDHAFRETRPHSYPHLFRHFDDIALDSWLRCCSPADFWKSVCDDSSTTVPADEEVLQMDVHSVIVPHVRFLVEVLKGGTGRLAWIEGDESSSLPTTVNGEEIDEECPVGVEEEVHHTMRLHLSVPDWYYRISIDRIIAPWHAYLQRYCPQQSGSALRGDELTAFLDVCRTGSKDAFLQLCREWNDNEETATSVHTPDNLDRFLTTFRCGLLPACRNVLNTARIPPAEMVALLVTHGANFLQKDDKRISGLHWAAATRNAGGLEVLLISWCQERYPDETCYSAAAKLVLQEVVTGKDGATVLHWAACGVGRNWIGTGGSTEICHYLLELVGSDPAVVDATTRNTGATPFMWAAWSGSIDAARLLVEEGGANARHVNSQGQTAAHWAAAAGQLEMFRYLVEELGLESDQADHSGETPLDYAKQYHQDSILDWCKRHLEDRQISPPRNEGSMRI